MDDKRQITAVFGCTVEGEFLPPQIIYGGKTTRCLPTAKFPSSRDITFSKIIGQMRKPLKAII